MSCLFFFFKEVSHHSIRDIVEDMLRMVGSTGCSAASCDMVWYKPERAEVRALMGGASLFAQ